MAKRSKAYNEAAAKIQEGKLYNAEEAATLAIETAGKKTNSTIEVALKLGVDPRKADQMIRGTVSLPHGTGKVARVIVFANGAAADAAREAGADEVGGVRDTSNRRGSRRGLRRCADRSHFGGSPA